MGTSELQSQPGSALSRGTFSGAGLGRVSAVPRNQRMVGLAGGVL